MQTEKRESESGVIGHLKKQPYRYQFVQAVRVLVLWLRQQGVSYDDAFAHVLRFQNSVSLGFPASEIEALMTGAEACTAYGEAGQITLTPAFMGLLGSMGTLPFHHSEQIGALQLRDKDDSARAFLDIFSNRMVALFFQAWGKYRVEHKLDTQGQDGLLPMLMSLGGVQRKAGNSGGLFNPRDDVSGFYAALLRTRPIAAESLAGILSEYFGVPIWLEQFVGSWDYIPASKRSTLGTANPRLGYGATLGVRTWRHDLRMRVCIGPLDKNMLERFLPNGDGAGALAQMLAHFGAPSQQYEVKLILSEPCIKPLTLTAHRPNAKRLGWDAFLIADPKKAFRATIPYLLRAL